MYKKLKKLITFLICFSIIFACFSVPSSAATATATYDKDGTFTAPTPGTYRIVLQGQQGGNYGSYYGGAGGKVEFLINLNTNESLNFYLNKNGGASNNSRGAAGGGATYCLKNGAVVAIAAGGGGANSNNNGGNGGISTTSNNTVIAGATGFGGGGAGSTAGSAGVSGGYVKGAQITSDVTIRTKDGSYTTQVLPDYRTGDVPGYYTFFDVNGNPAYLAGELDGYDAGWSSDLKYNSPYVGTWQYRSAPCKPYSTSMSEGTPCHPASQYTTAFHCYKGGAGCNGDFRIFYLTQTSPSPSKGGTNYCNSSLCRKKESSIGLREAAKVEVYYVGAAAHLTIGGYLDGVANSTTKGFGTFIIEWSDGTRTGTLESFDQDVYNGDAYKIISTATAGHTAGNTTSENIPISGTITSRLSMHLVFTTNYYSVSLSKGTGIDTVTATGTQNASGNFKYNTNVYLSATTKPGYTFKNWTGTATSNSLNYTYPNIKSNSSFTASATENSYTVIFNANPPSGRTASGSTASMALKCFSNSGTINLNKNGFAVPGYIFKEWNTKADGTGTSYPNQFGVIKTSPLTYNNGNFNLYAQWTPTKVTCIDIDVLTGKELGRNTKEAVYSINSTASSNNWGTSTKFSEYYNGYTYISQEDATHKHTCTVSPTINYNNLVYRLFNSSTDKTEMIVKTPDLRAPLPVENSSSYSSTSQSIVKIGWTKTLDKASTYSFTAYSLDKTKINAKQLDVSTLAKKKENKLLMSNTAAVVIESGVSGYYCLVTDKNYMYIPNEIDELTGKIKKYNDYFTESDISKAQKINANSPFIDIDITKYPQEKVFLHIAAVDNAGNVSEVYTHPYSVKDEAAFPLFTEKINIVSNDKNYFLKNGATNTYFVKGSSNNESLFNLNYNGYTTAPFVNASSQINASYFEIIQNKKSQFVEEFTPINVTSPAINWNSSESTTFGRYKVTSNDILTFNNLILNRTNYGSNINTNGKFSVSSAYDGKTITILPEIRVYHKSPEYDLYTLLTFDDLLNLKYHSSRDSYLVNGVSSAKDELDTKNAINLVVDATKPTITKSEAPFQLIFTQNEAGIVSPQKIITTFTDKTADNLNFGSGVLQNNKQIKVEIIPEQGSTSKIYYEDTPNTCFTVDYKDCDSQNNSYKSGTITLNINPATYEEMAGFITVKITITDNVGNTSTESYRFLTMTLNSSLRSIASLNKTSFRGGEQGQILIETLGYVDKVDIEFCEEFKKYNTQTANVPVLDENGNYNNKDLPYVLDTFFPYSEDGSVRVTKDLQTRLWGTNNFGGMESLENPIHCYMTHYFYVPLNTPVDTYYVTVTAHKYDDVTGKDYTISATLPFNVTDGDVTIDFKDTIKDN